MIIHKWGVMGVRNLSHQQFFQQGVGLIEVLITVLLLATGLLGVASMQVRSLEQNAESLTRTQANLLAYDILEQVRMASPVAPGAVVTPSATAITTLAAAKLPSGSGSIACDTARLCTVTITWSEGARSASASDQQPSTFKYSATL